MRQLRRVDVRVSDPAVVVAEGLGDEAFISSSLQPLKGIDIMSDPHSDHHHHHPHNSLRFHDDVSLHSAMPGELLASASFRYGAESIVAWIIESEHGNRVVLKGMATNFGAVPTSNRLFKFSLVGGLIEKLRDLPFDPHANAAALTFNLVADDPSFLFIDPKKAKVVFSPVRAPNGIDPDAAIVNLTTADGQTLPISLTGLRRGNPWWIIVPIVIIVLGASGCASPRDGEQRTVTERVHFIGHIGWTPEGSTVGLGVSGEYSHETTISPVSSSTAPVSSTTTPGVP